MKRLCILMALSIASSFAMAGLIEVDGIFYNFDASTHTASVTSNPYGVYNGDIVIPNHIVIDGVIYIIRSIEDDAFMGSTSLTSVSIADSIISIGNYAFQGCSALSCVVVGLSASSFGTQAFDGCPNLSKVTLNCADFIRRDHPSTGAFHEIFSQVREFQLGDVVTSIGGYAFKRCTNMTTISFPNTLKYIGQEAFKNCLRLKEAQLPNSLTAIGQEAFAGCSGLENIILPDSISKIDSGVFSGCSSLASIHLPNSISLIYGDAFKGCSSITSLTLPSSLISIGGEAFYGCSGLTEVTIPASVNRIYDQAFAGNPNLKRIELKGNELLNYKYYRAPDSFGYNMYSFASIFGTQVEEYILDESTTSIADYTFYGCWGLTTFTIPEFVKEIGLYSFAHTGIKRITIPNTVSSIADHAFWGGSLEEVIIDNSDIAAKDYNGSPYEAHTTWSFGTIFGKKVKRFIFGESVTTVGEGCFADCENESLALPKSITKFTKRAFYHSGFSSDRTSLKSVTIDCDFLVSKDYIKDGATIPVTFTSKGLCDIFGDQVTEYILGGAVTRIGNAAFALCDSLKSITISNSVTSIGENAFRGSTKLADITIPNSVTTIGSASFAECTGLTEITLGSNLQAISDYMFYKCTSLKDVPLPNSITSIGEDAFYWCRELPKINLPNSIKSIGRNAFSFCLFSDITLPSSLEEIDSYAFSYLYGNPLRYDGTGLTEITIPSSVKTIGEEAFKECRWLTKVTINSNDVIRSAYTTEYNIGTIFGNQVQEFVLGDNVQEIGEYAFYGNTNLQSFTTPNFLTTVGTGAFADCTGLLTVTINSNEFASKAYSISSNFGTIFGSQVKEYIFGGQVRGIGNYALYDCKLMENVIIPSSVLTIGNRAFQGCQNLTAIELPDGIRGIGVGAFQNCSRLAGINLPGSVTNIGASAFLGCSSLVGLTIGSSVTSIGSTAFSGCSKLAEVSIPASVTSIGESSFNSCSRVTINSDALVSKAYTLSSNFGTIFGGQVKEYILADSITSIGDYAFAGCSKMTSVTMPGSVTSIGNRTFQGCSGLTDVELPGTLKSIGSSAFEGCGITKIILPNALQSVGNRAFYSCPNLKYIIIPNSLGRIGTEAFGEGAAQSYIYIVGQAVPAFGPTVLPTTCALFVPYGSKSEYQTMNWDTTLSGIEEYVNMDENHSPQMEIGVPAYFVSFDLLGKDCRWTCSEANIATVDGSGLVTPLTDGVVTIAATDDTDAYTICTVTVGTGIEIKILGDVNADGKVNAADVVAVINYVLMGSLTDGDVNDDGKVNVADVVATINYVLTFDATRSYKPALAHKTTSVQDDTVYLTGTCTSGGIDICLSNGSETEYTAFQLTLYLPNGMRLGDIETDNQSLYDHKVVFRLLDDGGYLILAYSPANSPINSAYTRLLHITIEGTEDGMAKIDEAYFVTPTVEVQPVPGIVFCLTTNINGVYNADAVTDDYVYDLSGKRVLSSEGDIKDLPKGIYIQGGQKFLLKKNH